MVPSADPSPRWAEAVLQLLLPAALKEPYSILRFIRARPLACGENPGAIEAAVLLARYVLSSGPVVPGVQAVQDL